jgi:hypothetical protein
MPTKEIRKTKLQGRHVEPQQNKKESKKRKPVYKNLLQNYRGEKILGLMRSGNQFCIR